MVTISVKALWIVAIGLTAFIFVLVNFPTEVGVLASPPELPIYTGLAFLWIVRWSRRSSSVLCGVESRTGRSPRP